MPSRPNLQACRNTVSPSPSICSLNRTPAPASAKIISSVALRRSKGARRRSSPFSSITSEGVEEYAFVTMAVANEIERSDAVVISRDCLPIDDAGARTQACQRLDDQREAIGEVIAGTAVELHLCGILAGDDPKAIVLDLVQPVAA